MYCPTCQCEFVGWSSKCPQCQSHMVQEVPSISRPPDRPISYEALVELVRNEKGRLRLELATTEVGRRRGRSFPYFGYGYAWAKGVQGHHDDLLIDLDTTEVGRQRTWRFPYNGRGLAWVREMEGNVAGNGLSLAATRVVREETWSFPYFGYGYAWTEEMVGSCGEQLRARVRITEVGRDREQCFPWRGYGFAWERRGILVLTFGD